VTLLYKQFIQLFRGNALLNIAAVVLISSLSLAPNAYSADSLEKRLENLAWTDSFSPDDFHKKSQLTKSRDSSPAFDECSTYPKQENNFSDAIESAVRTSLISRSIITDSAIQAGYALPIVKKAQKVSLISNPLCLQGKAEMTHLLGAERVPDAETIETIRLFTLANNSDRLLALKGDDAALTRFTHRWTGFMSCLAYAESLNTSDELPAHEAFAEATSSFVGMEAHFSTDSQGKLIKPSGVHFGIDHTGDYFRELRAARAEGRLTPEFLAELNAKYRSWPVVGLFQFNASPTGNITSCVDQWNELVSNSCQINKRSKQEMFLSFSSKGQTVNAFCGVQKIVQAFNSQINTQNATGTDLGNIKNGKLEKEKNRCVSLVARSGAKRIYAHFGPLANSVGNNLKGLMSCVRTVIDQ
jgi:hypothetical protein